MPKKTKKQKILAEQRVAQFYKPAGSLATPFQYLSSPSSIPKPTYAANMVYIKRDLLKTVIIGTIFIIGEFVLAKFIS